jgi:guanine deaminase
VTGPAVAPALVVVGDVLQTPAGDRFEHIPDAVVAVDGDGVIAAVERLGQPAGVALVAAAEEVVRLPSEQALLPGLVDLHVHAPQWPQLGTCLDLPLERWLFEHTFPLEARYRDAAFAAAVWADVVPTLLRHGTTTAVYFAANDGPSALALAVECARHGQRAFVGRVAMDHPTGTPDWYRDASAADGVRASAESIDAIIAVDGGRLVRPIVTPRFAPACTDALLEGLGELAAATGTLVQTHCSESDWAHGYSIERFGTTDTVALERFGLLRPGSVLAHANHVTDADADVIAGRGGVIAHCPLSNAYFANAVLPVRRLLDRGVAIGLGTDIAGGASPGLLGQCQHAVTMSRLLADGVDARLAADRRGVAGSAIDVVTAWWMATVGAADALGIPVGLLAPGRRFDAIAVDTSTGTGAVSRLAVGPGAGTAAGPGSADDDPRLTFERIVRLAGPTDITAVWVDAHRVV